jgi:hypothetical protein
MERLDFTLLTDGSADAILIQPLKWLLQQHLTIPVDGTWADLRRLPRPPKLLRERIEMALDLYPCDLLFVHRDAEAEPHAQRVAEITTAAAGLTVGSVPVVPVRMQEAWLLIDEPALRRAAGNPSGRIALVIPNLGHLENLPNPKQVLHDLLLNASELTGRRRQKLRPGQMALRLGDLIQDYSPLRCVPAFRELEAIARHAVANIAGNRLVQLGGSEPQLQPVARRRSPTR